MHVTNKRPPCFALQMKQLSAINVIAISTMPTRSLLNTNASLFTTPLPKTPLSVISARRGVHIYFAKKTEQYFAGNVTFLSMKSTNLPSNTTGFFSQA